MSKKKVAGYRRSTPICEKTGKLALPDYVEAVRYAARLTEASKEDLGVMDAYQCPHCHAWHVGHKRKKKGPPIDPYKRLKRAIP